MKKQGLVHLSPIDFERRSRWRKQQLWQARLINLYGFQKAREIAKGGEKNDQTRIVTLSQQAKRIL